MKANELMIGDWVKFKNSDLAHKVIAAAGKSIKVDKTHWYSANIFDPIPLTPEILEKNGFEEDDGAYIYYTEHYDDYINWCGTILKIGCDNGNMELADVQYVHQLQHALRLCGIKKEIEL